MIAVETSSSLQVGTPELLFNGRFVREDSRSGGHSYDVGPDGQRFVMMEPVPDEPGTEASRTQLRVVLSWHQELLERVPLL